MTSPACQGKFPDTQSAVGRQSNDRHRLSHFHVPYLSKRRPCPTREASTRGVAVPHLQLTLQFVSNLTFSKKFSFMAMTVRGLFSAGAILALTMGRVVAEILYAGVNSGNRKTTDEIRRY
jgi:hypothetical protein